MLHQLRTLATQMESLDRGVTDARPSPTNRRPGGVDDPIRASRPGGADDRGAPLIQPPPGSNPSNGYQNNGSKPAHPSGYNGSNAVHPSGDKGARDNGSKHAHPSGEKGARDASFPPGEMLARPPIGTPQTLNPEA